MDNELVANGRFDLARSGAFMGGAAIGGDAVDVDRFVRHAAGNAAVDHIDYAANGRGAVGQGGGSAQHLYAIGGEGVDRHGVIDRGVRDVEAAYAVGEDAHAFALEAAQHGARCIGAEGGRGYARLAGERVADRRTQRPGQLFAGHDRRT